MVLTIRSRGHMLYLCFPNKPSASSYTPHLGLPDPATAERVLKIMGRSDSPCLSPCCPTWASSWPRKRHVSWCDWEMRAAEQWSPPRPGLLTRPPQKTPQFTPYHDEQATRARERTSPRCQATRPKLRVRPAHGRLVEAGIPALEFVALSNHCNPPLRERRRRGRGKGNCSSVMPHTPHANEPRLPALISLLAFLDQSQPAPNPCAYPNRRTRNLIVDSNAL